MKEKCKNIPLFKVFMHNSVPKAVEAVLLSGFIGQGPKVEEFEEILQRHFSSTWVNTLNSATSGLQLAVHMTKKSDNPNAEILTTPLTCTATNFAIMSEGVKLRWVDVDPTTGNMDMDDLARKVSPNTLAIMLVHWGGYPCDLEKVREIQAKCMCMYGFVPPVIEDCAHAWGSIYQDKMVGTHGNTAVFSFQAIKHLTTGDGGCMISPNDEHYNRAKLLRWYGLDRNSSADFRCQQNIKEWGFKYHMNDVAATIGLHNYPHIDGIIKVNRDNALYYTRGLADIPGVTLMENKEDRKSSYWVYTVCVEDRDAFVRKMKEKNIMVSQVHDRNDKHECLKDFRCLLPNLDVFSKKMICLPCGWWVTKTEREYIVDCIKEGW